MKKYVLGLAVALGCVCLLGTTKVSAKEPVTVKAEVSNPLVDYESDVLKFESTWFKLLRLSVLKTVSESHLIKNQELEANLGYILNQTTCPQFYIGNARMAGVGCEIAATYNALKLQDKTVPISSIIYNFERSRYLMLGGKFGTDPFAIGEYLSKTLSVDYVKYSNFYDMEKVVRKGIDSYNVYIISFWNQDDIKGGLHTITFYTSEGKIHVMNRNSRSTDIEDFDALEDFVKSGRFILGYKI